MYKTTSINSMPRYNNYFYDDDYRPRPSAEIYALRKEGRLDEARRKAESILNNGGAEYDVVKAYAFTLIDICKREKRAENTKEACNIAALLVKMSRNTFEPKAQEDEFAEILARSIKSLNLSVNPQYARIQEADALSKNGRNDDAWEILSQMSDAGTLPDEAHETYGWVIYRYLKEHSKTMTSEQVRGMLVKYMRLTNMRPSLLHSLVLGLALGYSKDDDAFNLPAFLRHWNLQYLRDEDYEEGEKKDGGDSIPSLLSRLARAISSYPLEDIKSVVEDLPQDREEFIDSLRELFFWKIYNSTRDGDPKETWDLFEQYLDFYPEEVQSSSKNHSRVLDLAERVMKDSDAYRFYDFFRRWNPNNLTLDDWKKQKGDNGETYNSLAEKCIKKAKDAIDSLTDGQMGDLQWLIDLYGEAVKRYPDDDWHIRSKALLHLRAGQMEEARVIYKDLCLKMSEKYYIWQEYADCWDDNDVRIALLCKAISLEKNEDFIGKIRLELAKRLVFAGKYAPAALELKKYKDHYSKKGWSLSSEISVLEAKCKTSGLKTEDNKDLYADYILKAENIAFENIPYTNVALVDKWKREDGKEFMSFTNGESIEFAMETKRFPILRKSRKGQVWSMKLYEEEIEKTVQPANTWQRPKRKAIVKYVPLTVTCSDIDDWGCLPVRYGYVQSLNTEKKVYHIYTSDSVHVHGHYEDAKLKTGDFVSFRMYAKTVQGEKRLFPCEVIQCDESKVFDSFPSRIAVVDEVNNERGYFHFILNSNGLSGRMRYDRTDLRPSIGDCIRMRFFIKEVVDKEYPERTKMVPEVIKAEATEETDRELVRNISGQLVLKYRSENYTGEPDFAFVDDYYVHKSLLEQGGITEDCYVSGRAICDRNGKWRVLEINKLELET